MIKTALVFLVILYGIGIPLAFWTPDRVYHFGPISAQYDFNLGGVLLSPFYALGLAWIFRKITNQPT